ncbi:hypothetical protein F383_28630 [Gossypium arboreum]|uniref:Uncharacterized protein n=1 Tax=Gossypium arboreum TaxID=29729 RepID=A0A0B0MQ16_GOSAR|nr:hypothetical protein F383_28630 [Gossypium arboreum]
MPWPNITITLAQVAQS